ncbi:HNH endonuclease [Tenacibaculum haliotis]|uniref:HNH endonuclease n=1 Tax=Tenacibaculum haliotis TaxID=1888914 RepID=UPI0021AEE732|nr:HNH endonuclease [Tenacibaculum haliotis]MCT4697576.1 HNH endonuclease [Tenacibaculum haliotis]
MIEAILKEAAKEVAVEGLKEVSETEIKDIPLETIDMVENGSLEALELENNMLKELIIERINTINSHLEGIIHPESGIPYVKDIVKLRDGRIIEGVFPEFKSFADIQLPEGLLQETDRNQMGNCNEQLKEMLDKNPELREKFTERQLEQIDAGYKPEGYTWHHHQQVGKMQLVESSVHDVSRHTGGKSLWGGGRANR